MPESSDPHIEALSDLLSKIKEETNGGSRPSTQVFRLLGFDFSPEITLVQLHRIVGAPTSCLSFQPLGQAFVFTASLIWFP